jgi:nucleoid-associated protein YgaU
VTELTPEQFARRLAPSRTYVVRRGDHLAEIARRTLGSDSRSALKRLMDANRDRLEDPDRLRVGMSLRIPS